MSAAIEKRGSDTLRDIALAVAITAAAHLVLYFVFTIPKPVETKTAPGLKKVVFLPLNDMPKTPAVANLVRWLDYGDPTLISKPSQKHGFSSVYSASGLRQPEPDLGYGVFQLRSKTGIGGFEEIRLGGESPGAELSKISGYKAAPVPQLPFKIQKRNSVEYPCWRNEDGEPLPQLFANAEEIRKKVQAARPEGKTVLKVSYYDPEFVPRPRIQSSCGNRELDSAAVAALVARPNLLNSPDGKTGEPCYIEIEWQKGQ